MRRWFALARQARAIRSFLRTTAGIGPLVGTSVVDDRQRILLRRIVSGDSVALGELYDDVAPELYSMCGEILGSATMRDECVEDVFADLCRHGLALPAPSLRIQVLILGCIAARLRAESAGSPRGAARSTSPRLTPAAARLP